MIVEPENPLTGGFFMALSELAVGYPASGGFVEA
jgi:hypothetical protein